MRKWMRWSLLDGTGAKHKIGAGRHTPRVPALLWLDGLDRRTRYILWSSDAKRPNRILPHFDDFQRKPTTHHQRDDCSSCGGCLLTGNSIIFVVTKYFTCNIKNETIINRELITKNTSYQFEKWCVPRSSVWVIDTISAAVQWCYTPCSKKQCGWLLQWLIRFLGR